MYLLNEKNKIALYDLDFNNSNEIISMGKYLANESITISKSIKSAHEYAMMTERGNKQSIYDPVYFGENAQDDTIKVTEFKSKTPYTLAIIAYYAKNNILKTLYSSMEFSNDKQIYLEKLVDRIMSGYSVFPQLYMTKCHFDNKSYQNHDKLFESLKNNPYSLDFLIEEYYPDLKAFLDLLPYIDFTLEKEYKDNFYAEDSWQAISAKNNTETLKQLGLTPNIRK